MIASKKKEPSEFLHNEAITRRSVNKKKFEFFMPETEIRFAKVKLETFSASHSLVLWFKFEGKKKQVDER